ncbi:hypothetical protein VCR15J2_470525 [Vibrio coralliirubri]|nr:hypothetical protein VCR15J2_470525 [Vibrio coralliirubri]
MKITDLIDPLGVNQNLVNHEKQDMGDMYLLTHKLNSSAYAIRLLIYTGSLYSILATLNLNGFLV